MDKLLVICGPTSTGKTTLAISLAKKLNGEIVSADSRQVYKGLDIGTGKDLPKGAKLKYLWIKKFGYYEIHGVKIWGYDLADPRHSFSVSQYLKFAERVIADIIKRGKIPILVGGTGFYIKGVIDGIPTAEVPKSSRLRKSLETKNPGELFEMLAQMDSIKAAEMNLSDKKNPRRLIRAIEIATWKTNHGAKESEAKKSKSKFNVLQIGLTADEKVLTEKIEQRVSERFKERLKNEIAGLLKNHVDWNMQSMSSMGYGEWRDFFEGRKSEVQVINEWTTEEKKYVKRQIVWFKKDKRISWFDITNADYPVNVEKFVEKWDNTESGREQKQI
jgi:tRNA dimethylallyltransferase